jgi:hypothetical protein
MVVAEPQSNSKITAVSISIVGVTEAVPVTLRPVPAATEVTVPTFVV